MNIFTSEADALKDAAEALNQRAQSVHTYIRSQLCTGHRSHSRMHMTQIK